MARKVKCIDTGEYSTSDVAYKAPNGKYWTSEDKYRESEKIKEWKTKCHDLIIRILNYDYISPYIKKKINELVNKYDGEIIYETINGETDNILWALENRDFNNEIVKFQYVCIIIENNAPKYKRIISSMKESELRNKNIEVPDVIELPGLKDNGKDIRQFLD